MRRGFKTEAKELALGVRAEIGLDAFERFDPYTLADEYGIPVYPLGELGQHDDARQAAAHYAGAEAPKFSAALVPLGHKRIVLDNDSHARVRRRNSISHEMSHIVLEHKFNKVLLTKDGSCVFDKDQEGEAGWLGSELLIPYAAAERAAQLGLTDEQVADLYDVSVPLARPRMNSSGARLVASRKRAWRNRKPGR